MYELEIYTTDKCFFYLAATGNSKKLYVKKSKAQEDIFRSKNLLLDSGLKNKKIIKFTLEKIFEENFSKEYRIALHFEHSPPLVFNWYVSCNIKKYDMYLEEGNYPTEIEKNIFLSKIYDEDASIPFPPTSSSNIYLIIFDEDGSGKKFNHIFRSTHRMVNDEYKKDKYIGVVYIWSSTNEHCYLMAGEIIFKKWCVVNLNALSYTQLNRNNLIYEILNS